MRPRGRLYVFAVPPLAPNNASRLNPGFRFVYITDDKYIKDARPVEDGCDCLTCRRYSRGYLRHLYRANEAAFQRLATIHNLRFIKRWRALRLFLVFSAA